MTKKVELFSGKVLTVPPTDVSANRYKWLKLSEAEPSLGAPSEDGAFIYSDQTGVRTWTVNLRTDADGNLFTGSRIQSSVDGQDLEIGTTDDENLNVRITSNMVIEGDLVVNGNLDLDIELTDINLQAGSVIRIGGVEVLSETTLGSGVVNSSLESVGTVTTGTWQADPIGTEYGGTGIGAVGTGITQNAILYGNGVNAMGQATGSAFQVLQLDATGTPVFGALDAGGY